MIEILDQSTESCLAVHFSGKVTGAEYQQFLDALGQRLSAAEKVSLVLELSGFEFYGDFESARQDFKFGFGDYKRVRRAAFVGDQKWIEWFTRLVGPFTRAEEKHFPAGQIETACAWAGS
jgi:SpoIIAA-like